MKIPEKKGRGIHIRLEPRQKAQLKALAKAHNTTVSALIRYAVEQFLEAEGAAAEGHEDRQKSSAAEHQGFPARVRSTN
jgi:predicted transcriptional regulator